MYLHAGTHAHAAYVDVVFICVALRLCAHMHSQNDVIHMHLHSVLMHMHAHTDHVYTGIHTHILI